MNKKDIAKNLSTKTLLSAKESLQAVEIIFEIIEESLLSGDEVSVVNFGKFMLQKQKPRPVRNPKTMEEMTLKSFDFVKFKPSSNLKNKLKTKE